MPKDAKAALVALLKPSDKKTEDKQDEGDEGDLQDAILEDIWDSIKADNFGKFKSALKDLLSC